jgi:hypothetical protein
MVEITKTVNIGDISLEPNNNAITVVSNANNLASSDHSAPEYINNGEMAFNLTKDKDGNDCYVLMGPGDVAATSITVPPTYAGLPVIGIGQGAFRGTSVRHITIPASVISIEPHAFLDSALESVVFEMGSKLEDIGDEAFRNTKLTSVEIPASVVYMGSMSFSTSTLTNLTFERGNYQTVYFYNTENWENVSCYAWGRPPSSANASNTFLMHKVTDRLWSVSLPRTLTGIRFNNGNASTGISPTLETHNIPVEGPCIHNKCWQASGEEYAYPFTEPACGYPYGTLTIGNYAFVGTNITSLSIPMNCIEIGDYAFSSCKNLANVYFRCGLLTRIGECAFENCTAIDNVEFYDDKSSVTMAGPDGISYAATLKSNLTRIEKDAFVGCSEINRIKIPKSVTWIGQCAFKNNSDLDADTTCMLDNYGWFYTDGTDMSGGTHIYEYSLNNSPLGNKTAEYLTSTYVDYNWYKLDQMPAPTVTTYERTINIRDYTLIANKALICVGTDDPIEFEMSNGSLAVTLDDLRPADGDNYIKVAVTSEGLIPSDYTEIGPITVSALTYEEEEDYLVVTGPGTEMPKSLRISGTHGDKLVKKIAAAAFQNNSTLTELIIENGIKYIGERAFNSCSSLTSVTFEDSEKITIYFKNPGWEVVSCYTWHEPADGGVATYPVAWPGSRMINLGNNMCSLTIPANTTGVVFNNGYRNGDSVVTSLVQTEDIIKGIRHGACWQWSKVNNAYCVEEYDYADIDTSECPVIESGAFGGCTSLTNVKLSNIIRDLGTSMFSSCGKLTNVVFSAPSCLLKIGEFAFQNSDLSGECVLPQSLKHIGDCAFRNTKLKTINVPPAVSRIGASAFSGCRSLVFVDFGVGNISRHLEYIGVFAFENCTSLPAIEIPHTVTTIGLDAFSGCSALSTVVINDHYGWRGDKYVTTENKTYVYIIPSADVANSSTFARLLKTDLLDYTLTNINKLWVPEIDLTGDILTIVDKSGFAESFDIYVNGSKKQTITAK